MPIIQECQEVSLCLHRNACATPILPSVVLYNELGIWSDYHGGIACKVYAVVPGPTGVTCN